MKDLNAEAGMPKITGSPAIDAPQLLDWPAEQGTVTPNLNDPTSNTLFDLHGTIASCDVIPLGGTVDDPRPLDGTNIGTRYLARIKEEWSTRQLEARENRSRRCCRMNLRRDWKSAASIGPKASCQ